MADINVSIDTRELDRYADETPRKLKNALRSAIRTTTTWARKEVEKRLSIETEIPISVFKKHRMKSSTKRNEDGIESGRVWIGYNPIRAKWVGKLSQDDAGAWAGKYFFKSAFLAQIPKTQPIDMFKRTTKDRFPLMKPVVDLPQAGPITAQVGKEAEAEVVRRFRAKFNG